MPMGEAAATLRMTPEEYLAFERASEQKHQYVDGEVFAMAGGTREHSLIGSNIRRELHNALRDLPGEVHGSDLRIKVMAEGHYFYPDVSVVCGRPRFDDDQRDTVTNPKLIAEVLSDSTERYDRGDKFASYRKIDTLQDYVLVSQTEPRVEHYKRQPDGTWIYRALGAGERLVLGSLDCEIPVDRIYAKVFEAPPT